MNNEDAIELFSEITKLRHELHCTQDAGEYIQIINNIIDEYNRIKKEIDVPILDIQEYLPESTYSEDCEDDSCCGDCELCREVANDFVWEHKDKDNQIIEEWLTSIEQMYELDSNTLCPTGIARMRMSEDTY
jgi:hypothetical protein